MDAQRPEKRRTTCSTDDTRDLEVELLMILLWGVAPLLYTYVTRHHTLCNSSLGDANRVAEGTTKQTAIPPYMNQLKGNKRNET